MSPQRFPLNSPLAEMRWEHRDGAQAGGCPLLVPPEDGGRREQKADVLSVLPVQHPGHTLREWVQCLGERACLWDIYAPETPMGTARMSLSTPCQRTSVGLDSVRLWGGDSTQDSRWLWAGSPGRKQVWEPTGTDTPACSEPPSTSTCSSQGSCPAPAPPGLLALSSHLHPFALAKFSSPFHWYTTIPRVGHGDRALPEMGE